MNNENIVIKGTPQNNKSARILIATGAAVLLLSFIVAFYVFENCKGYENFGFGHGGYYYWCVIYDSFGEFYIDEFFNVDCYYGYMLLVGMIALIVGLVIKLNTEKCEVTVTHNNIIGKLPHEKDVTIPLNQVTALHPSSFNGISISSIGNVSNFRCIENRDEVIKAISYLLANPQQGATQTTGANTTTSTSANETEQLKRLKELLDTGVITQEEFDAKKRQLLGL